MTHTPAYTKRQFVRAVNGGAVLGWCAVVAPFVLDQGPIVFAALFGLPIASLTCWIVAAPILAQLMKSPISWTRAAVWGAGIAALMAALSIAIGRFFGWRQSLNDSSFSQIGGGDFIREIDGILTPYGWTKLAQSTALFVGAGIAIALILRAWIGPGAEPPDTNPSP